MAPDAGSIGINNGDMHPAIDKPKIPYVAPSSEKSTAPVGDKNPTQDKTAEDATRGLRVLGEGIKQGIDEVNELAAQRIFKGEDPKTMGIAPSARPWIQERVRQLQAERDAAAKVVETPKKKATTEEPASKNETPKASKVESEKNLKDREKNAESLVKRKQLLANEYDVEFADVVTSGLIALGYEGTDSSRTTSSTQSNIEATRLNLESSTIAISVMTELVSKNMDPELGNDLAKFMEKGNAATPEEANELNNRFKKITSTIYKASRGNKKDLKDPAVAAVAKQIESFKSMTTDEIINFTNNDEIIAFYKEWREDPKNKGREPFRPSNFDKAIFDDMVLMQINESRIQDKLVRIEQEETPLVIDPKKLKSSPLKSLSTALVSVYGDVGGTRVKTDIFGVDTEYESEAREAIEVGVERTAALAETENKAKWGSKRKEGQSWLSRAGEVVKNNLDRGWRAMFSDKLHHAKEVRHGLRMMAEAGVETGLTSEFITAVDKEARKRIEKSRSEMSKFGRLKAKAKDFFSEVVGHERQLHSVKEQVIKEWRQKFDANPFDAKDNPIYDLVMSDMESRTEIARRVAESTQESLHLSGESKSKKTIKIESGSKYGKFLNENIFNVAVQEALARKKAGEANITGLSADLRVKLDKQLNDFYQTEQFKKWKDSLPKAEQELLPDSFTYATDILAQVEGSLIPNALELSDYYDKAKKLEIDLDLTIGTAQYGPNGEISPDGIGRVRLKKEVLARMHEKSAVFGAEDMDGGIKRAMFIARADELVNNPLGAAILGFVGGRMIMTTAKAAGGAIGVGVFGGVKAGFREWAKLGTELKQIDIEKAIGLRRAEDAKKYHKLEAFTNKSVVMSEHAANIDDVIAKLGESATPEGITQLMSHIVNGEARVSLGVKHRINLIGAKSVGGGESAERQNYQLERRKFDFAQAKARVELKKVAESSPEVWDAVRKELGFRKGTSIDKILEELRLTQEDNLLDGATIPEGFESVLGTITLEKQDSIKGRAKAFTAFRARSAVTQGAIVGVTAGLMTWGLGEYAEHHAQVIKTSVENVKSVVVSPDTPLHSDGLAHGIGEMKGITIHAKLPEGMRLEPIQGPSLENHHSFNIFVDGQDKPLVTGVGFDHDGMPSLTAAAQAQLNAHGITLTPQPLASHTIGSIVTGPEIAHPAEHITIRMGDLPGREEGGIWDWMMHSVRGQNPDVGINTQTNGAYKLFRAYENMRGNDNFAIQEEPGIPHRIIHTVTTHLNGQTNQEVLPAPNPDNMIIKDLPALFATPEGHQKIADVVAESVRMHDAGQTLDRFHQLVYTAAVSGEGGIPNPQDTAYIMQQFDLIGQPQITELVTPHEILIEVSKPIVEEVACSVKREVVDGFAKALPLIVDWHRPLEAAEGTKAPTAATYESNIKSEPIKPVEPKDVTPPGKKVEPTDKNEPIDGGIKNVDKNETSIKTPEKDKNSENKEVKEFEYKGVKIRVVVGDITKAKTDAILSPVDPTMNLSYGMVENAIADKMGRKKYIGNARKAKAHLAKIETGGVGDDAKKAYLAEVSRDANIEKPQPEISAIDALNSSLQVWDEKEHHKDGDLRFGSSIAIPTDGKLKDNGIKVVVLTNVRPEHHIKNISEADVAHMTGSAARAANAVGATSLTIPAIGTGTAGESSFGTEEARSLEGFLAGAINYIDTMQAVEVVPKRDKNGNFIPIYSEDGKEIRAVESTTIPVEGHKPLERLEFIIYAEPNESNLKKINEIIDESQTAKVIKKEQTLESSDKPEHVLVENEGEEKKKGKKKETKNNGKVDQDLTDGGAEKRNKKRIAGEPEEVVETNIKTKSRKQKSGGEPEELVETNINTNKRKKKKDEELDSTVPTDSVVKPGTEQSDEDKKADEAKRKKGKKKQTGEPDEVIETNVTTSRRKNKKTEPGLITPTDTPEETLDVTDDTRTNPIDEIVETDNGKKEAAKIVRKRRPGTEPELANESNIPNTELPIINPDAELPIEEHKDVKRRLKKNINIEDKPVPTEELNSSDIDKEVRTHLIEDQSLADFAALEYGAIARALNKMSNEEIQLIFEQIKDRPDIQAVYRAAMIGMRVLPQNFENSKSQYMARIDGSKKRIGQLEQSIEKETNRRLVSIFEPNFATEFNGKIIWEKAKSLNELPDFAEGSLVLPENVTVDREKIQVIADAALKELHSLNDEDQNIDVDNLRPLREEITSLEQAAIAEGILKISNGKRERNVRSGNRKAGDRAALNKIDEKIKILRKIEDRWDEYNRIIGYADNDLKSTSNRTVPITIHKKRGMANDGSDSEGQAKSVVIETNLSKATQQLLDAFQIDGKPIDVEYLLDHNTNITWRTGSGKAISNGRATIEFEEKGQTVNGVIEFDTEGNPTEDTKSFLKEHRFWDDAHEYRAVKPAYPGEIINYSQAEVDRLRAEIENQKEIAIKYQKLIDAIGDRNMEGSFANVIEVATEKVNDALSRKMDRLLQYLKKDDEYSLHYPMAVGAFGNENLSKFVKDTDRISVEDILLGAILLGNRDILKKLPTKTKEKIAELQEKVNLDDMAVLQYARSIDKPPKVTDENRAQVYKEDFTAGDAIKYVLRSKATEFHRINEQVPYDQAKVTTMSANYSI